MWENLKEFLGFIFFCLFILFILFSVGGIVVGLLAGIITFIDSINHLEVDEMQGILSEIAGEEVEIVRHTEIGWRGDYHTATLQIKIGDETAVAKCKNKMAGDTICFYYFADDSQIVTIW